MKTFLLLVFVACVAGQCVPPQCKPDTTSTICRDLAPGSNCRDIFAGTNQVPDYRCICGEGFEYKCKEDAYGRPTIYTCQAVNGTNTQNNTSTSCGDFTTCPDGSYCYTSANVSRCVCKDPGYYLDPNTKTCVPTCPRFSKYNPDTRSCVCVDGYVNDPSGQIQPYCVPVNNNTVTKCADGYRCPNCTTCVDTEKGPMCQVNDACSRCGIDFRCPNDVYTHFTCVDTTTGPQCVCEEGWAGPKCSNVRCFQPDPNTPVGCYFDNGHAFCYADANTREQYCVCQEGWFGPKCDQNGTISTNPCANVKCTGTNVHCEYGRCVCNPGYVPSVPTGDNYDPSSVSCVLGCDTTVCTGNYRCAVINGKPQCVCPYTDFGGADCSKPRCVEDKDCGDNSFCITATRSDVPSYCSCKPGFAGDYCNVTVTCNEKTCSGNRVCTNEGRCVCSPKYTGDNCTVPVNTNCKSYELYLKFGDNNKPLTAEQVEIVVVALVRVDSANVEVTGPEATRSSDVWKYVVTFCSDANVDGTVAQDDFSTSLSNGITNGLEVTEAPAEAQATTGSTTGAAGSLAVSVGVVLVAMVAAL